MSELLIELFSEEIPAGLQQKAATDLERLVKQALENAHIETAGSQAFATPRRITVHFDGLPKKSPARREERKGPRIDAPEQALKGFVSSAGVKLEDCQIGEDKKGQFYLAVIEQKGVPTKDIIKTAMPEIIRNFPWPKSMRWGNGTLKWVRPLHSILCSLDSKVVKFEIDHLISGNKSQGHRFMSSKSTIVPKTFSVKNFDDYHTKLYGHSVILESKKRADLIAKQAQRLAKKHKLKLIEDPSLLAENAGLVEWPVVLMGRFDKSFLAVPQEALIAAMKKHQKCFSLKKGQKLSNHFLLVANIEAVDKGKAIIEGNERVIAARLSDAKFFWDNDNQIPLEDMVKRLNDIVFHEKLGTVAERVERLQKLSHWLADKTGADADQAAFAAKLAKADLVSETVTESADMQGLAGYYLALNQGKDEDVALAMRDHYKPLGPRDEVPSQPVSIAVALAEKLELLAGFWSINEKPTGSKDPYALRRAALGVIRILLENRLRLNLKEALSQASLTLPSPLSNEKSSNQIDDLLGFFADRLKVYLRDDGLAHDLIDAVITSDDSHDLLMIVERVKALKEFLAKEEGRNLLAGCKRAANILRIEEKKDKSQYSAPVIPSLLIHPLEKALDKAMKEAAKAVPVAIEAENFVAALTAIAKLRAPIDEFFEEVIVNDDKAEIRANRLNLLNQIRQVTVPFADFSKIEGGSN